MRKTGKKVEAPKEELFKIEETELGKKGKAYIALRDERDKLNDSIEEAENSLISEMKKENKSRLMLEGVTLSVSYVEAKTKIKIEKPKV